MEKSEDAEDSLQMGINEEAARCGEAPGTEPTAHACDSCGTADPPKTCTRCRSVRYCSRVCQKAHWPVHKRTCTPVSTPKQPQPQAQQQETRPKFDPWSLPFEYVPQWQQNEAQEWLNTFPKTRVSAVICEVWKRRYETRIVIIDGWDNDQRPKNTMSIVPLSNKDAERIFRPPPDKEGLLDSLPLSDSDRNDFFWAYLRRNPGVGNEPPENSGIIKITYPLPPDQMPELLKVIEPQVKGEKRVYKQGNGAAVKEKSDSKTVNYGGEPRATQQQVEQANAKPEITSHGEGGGETSAPLR